MAALTPQAINLIGLVDHTLASADVAGDTFVNGGRSMLVVDNADASPITVTIDSLVDSDYGTDENIVVTVTNGTRVILGPFMSDRFNAVGGTVAVSYSAVTSVTVAVLALDARGW